MTSAPNFNTANDEDPIEALKLRVLKMLLLVGTFAFLLF